MPLTLRKAPSAVEPLRQSRIVAVERELDAIDQFGNSDLASPAVNPHIFPLQFQQSMLDASNKLGFPLVELPDKASLIDIMQPLPTCELVHR